jgi:hypothetical protein
VPAYWKNLGPDDAGRDQFERRPLPRGHADYEERYPVFRGTLEPDVTFLGFELSEEQVRSGTATDPDGWFFVVEGQPTEPRFGLDETIDFGSVGRSITALKQDDSNRQEPWSDIAWGDLVANARNDDSPPDDLAAENERRLDALSHALAIPSGERLNATLDDEPMGGVTWGHNAAHMGYIMLQLPVRLAIHADEMLKGIPPSS